MRPGFGPSGMHRLPCIFARICEMQVFLQILPVDSIHGLPGVDRRRPPHRRQRERDVGVGSSEAASVTHASSEAFLRVEGSGITDSALSILVCVRFTQAGFVVLPEKHSR